MKLSLFTICAIFGAASGFTILPSQTIAQRAIRESSSVSAPLKPTLLAASTLDTNEDSPPSDLSPEEAAALEIKNQEITEVKQELIAKYLSAGKSQDFAEQEVEKFLSDPERSEQYLEMRRYAKAQANELMGFESIFIVGGAFFLGLTGQVGMKYLAAYKDVYPGGDGPIPFL